MAFVTKNSNITGKISVYGKQNSKEISCCSSNSEDKRVNESDEVAAPRDPTSNNANQNPMHKFYITRLKHSLIISFLFLVPIQNVFMFLILQLSEKVMISQNVSDYRFIYSKFLLKDTVQILLESITFFIVSFLSIILMLYLIRNEKKLQEHPVLISLIIYVLITMNHLIPLMNTRREIGTVVNGSFVVFNIVVIYSILPLQKRVTIFLSLLISLKNLGLLAYFLVRTNLEISTIVSRVSEIVHFMTGT